jgi:hypothetical protein
VKFFEHYWWLYRPNVFSLNKTKYEKGLARPRPRYARQEQPGQEDLLLSGGDATSEHDLAGQES